MSGFFKNKIVWVTGASSGIGEALVYALAKRGARVVLSARNETELRRVATASGLSPNDFCIVPLDLADYKTMPAHAETVFGRFGRVDVLINNAGVSQRSLAVETDIEVDRRLMEIDYLGTVALIKAVLPRMLEAKSGHIAAIASVAGVVATPLRSSYAAAKHALIGFCDALRAEVYDLGLRVAVICPGFVKTNISVNALTANGTPQGTMDAATANGISAEVCAEGILRAIEAERAQTYVAGLKEKFGVFLKRFFPSLLRRLIRSSKVT